MSQLAEQPNSKTEDDPGQFNLEPKTARELFIVLNGQNAVLRNDEDHPSVARRDGDRSDRHDDHPAPARQLTTNSATRAILLS